MHTRHTMHSKKHTNTEHVILYGWNWNCEFCNHPSKPKEHKLLAPFSHFSGGSGYLLSLLKCTDGAVEGDDVRRYILGLRSFVCSSCFCLTAPWRRQIQTCFPTTSGSPDRLHHVLQADQGHLPLLTLLTGTCTISSIWTNLTHPVPGLPGWRRSHTWRALALKLVFQPVSIKIWLLKGQ